MAKQLNGMATKTLMGLLLFMVGGFGTLVLNHVMANGHPVTLQRLDTMTEVLRDVQVDVKTLLSSRSRQHGTD